MYKSKYNRFGMGTIVTLLFLLTASCSKTVRFGVSSVVPSAVGKVNISKDDNNNRLLVLNVRNLVDPSRLTPPKKAYIVWLQTRSAGNRNLGRLVSTEAYFSTERNAKFSTVIPADAVKIFITAEDNVNVQNPGGVTVLSTEEF